ncbi:hypothetical protein HK100_003047, partial [Physocladia obscura]
MSQASVKLMDMAHKTVGWTLIGLTGLLSIDFGMRAFRIVNKASATSTADAFAASASMNTNRMEASGNNVAAAFAKTEDEATWTAMDKALNEFAASLTRRAAFERDAAVAQVARIRPYILQSLVSPRTTLQKTAIGVVEGCVHTLRGDFVLAMGTLALGTETLLAVLELCGRANGVVVRLARSCLLSVLPVLARDAPAAASAFAAAALAALRRPAATSTKHLRIAAVDALCAVAMHMSVLAQTPLLKLAPVVEDAVRLALTDSATEVRDSAKLLYVQYTNSFEHNQERFHSTLTPQHLKTLRLKPAPPSVSPLTSAIASPSKLKPPQAQTQLAVQSQIPPPKSPLVRPMQSNPPTPSFSASMLMSRKPPPSMSMDPLIYRRIKLQHVPRDSIDMSSLVSPAAAAAPDMSLDFETPPISLDDYDNDHESGIDDEDNFQLDCDDDDADDENINYDSADGVIISDSSNSYDKHFDGPRGFDDIGRLNSTASAENFTTDPTYVGDDITIIASIPKSTILLPLTPIAPTTLINFNATAPPSSSTPLPLDSDDAANVIVVAEGTLTLQEEVAAALRPKGGGFIPQMGDYDDDEEEEVELDPTFAWGDDDRGDNSNAPDTQEKDTDNTDEHKCVDHNCIFEQKQLDTDVTDATNITATEPVDVLDSSKTIDSNSLNITSSACDTNTSGDLKSSIAASSIATNAPVESSISLLENDSIKSTVKTISTDFDSKLENLFATPLSLATYSITPLGISGDTKTEKISAAAEPNDVNVVSAVNFFAVEVTRELTLKNDSASPVGTVESGIEAEPFLGDQQQRNISKDGNNGVEDDDDDTSTVNDDNGDGETVVSDDGIASVLESRKERGSSGSDSARTSTDVNSVGVVEEEVLIDVFGNEVSVKVEEVENIGENVSNNAADGIVEQDEIDVKKAVDLNAEKIDAQDKTPLTAGTQVGRQDVELVAKVDASQVEYISEVSEVKLTPFFDQAYDSSILQHSESAPSILTPVPEEEAVISKGLTVDTFNNPFIEVHESPQIIDSAAAFESVGSPRSSISRRSSGESSTTTTPRRPKSRISMLPMSRGRSSSGTSASGLTLPGTFRNSTSSIEDTRSKTPTPPEQLQGTPRAGIPQKRGMSLPRPMSLSSLPTPKSSSAHQTPPSSPRKPSAPALLTSPKKSVPLPAASMRASPIRDVPPRSSSPLRRAATTTSHYGATKSSSDAISSIGRSPLVGNRTLSRSTSVQGRKPVVSAPVLATFSSTERSFSTNTLRKSVSDNRITTTSSASSSRNSMPPKIESSIGSGSKITSTRTPTTVGKGSRIGTMTATTVRTSLPPRISPPLGKSASPKAAPTPSPLSKHNGSSGNNSQSHQGPTRNGSASSLSSVGSTSTARKLTKPLASSYHQLPVIPVPHSRTIGSRNHSIASTASSSAASIGSSIFPAKRVTWAPHDKLVTILGISDNDNHLHMRQNQLSDAINGGVEGVWTFLELNGGHDAWLLEDVRERLEALVGAVWKDLGILATTGSSSNKSKSVVDGITMKRGLCIFRSVLEVPGVGGGIVLGSESVTDVLKSVLTCAAVVEDMGADKLEIEYEITNTLNAFESMLSFSVLLVVLTDILGQISEATPAVREEDGEIVKSWITSHQACYEMLARVLEKTRAVKMGLYDGMNVGGNVKADIESIDWDLLTFHIAQGLENKHPLTRKAAFDCAVALCKCRGSTTELYEQVLLKSGKRTWRQFARASSKDLIPMNYDGVSDIAAATLMVNPCTAYRMLKDFVKLETGDVIIQNGANSAVGQSVIQISKAFGIKTVNMIRGTVDGGKTARPDLSEWKSKLSSLGADIVITEEEMRSREVLQQIQNLGDGMPKLGFNCVGGKSSTNLARVLANGATMVTYGGMSKEPVPVPTSLLIFKDLQVKGFWMSRWNDVVVKKGLQNEQEEMIRQLSAFVKEGKLVVPEVEIVSVVSEESVDAIKAAFSKAMGGGSGVKQVPVQKKKLNGTVGFHFLPNQVHRKSIKKGFQFTIMIVGESGLGKSTLVNTLFNAPIAPTRESPKEATNTDASKAVEINSFTSDIEENGVKLKLTVIDTPGFGDFINNAEAHKPILRSIEERYEHYLEQESRVTRKNMVDSRVHACIYFIAPTGHSLKQLDVVFMKELGAKVNLIPVIAKSDLLTEAETEAFKDRILEDIKANNIQIYYPPVHDNDDPETVQEIKEIASRIPFSVIGSNQTYEHPPGSGKHIRGRKYPWGLIEVDNEAHCDFVKLRQMLIRSHMEELKEHTLEVLYENHRSQKLVEGFGNPAK